MEIEYLLIAQKVARGESGFDFLGVTGTFFAKRFPTPAKTYTLILRISGTALDREPETGLRIELVPPDGAAVMLSEGPLNVQLEGGALRAWAFPPVPLRFNASGPHYIRAVLSNGSERSLPITASRRA